MVGNKKIVMVFGTFDIFHKGHEEMFKQAKTYGNMLIAVIARDLNVAKIKGKPAINDEITRLAMIKHISGADRVVLGDIEDPYRRIREIKPNIICLGYDQEYYTDELEEKIKEFGLETKIIRLKAFQPEIYKTSKLL